MAPRSSWKGFLKLSLVSVPVRAFTANNTGAELRLNQLHKECNARVKYLKVCPEHGELKSVDIVSGYQYAKDQYVVIDPEELSKLRTESDRSIHIDGFVDPAEIGDLHLSGKTYYLLPDGLAGNRPYALLRQGMAEKGVCAIAQVVVAGREQLVMVRPVENLLVMSILSHAKTVKALDEFTSELEEEATTKEEMELAHTLIGASTIADFDFTSYEDQYVEKLGKLIKMKIDGEEIVQAPEPEEPKIINLMDALKKSVAEAQASGARKMAPSAGTDDEAGEKKTARKASRKKKTG